MRRTKAKPEWIGRPLPDSRLLDPPRCRGSSGLPPFEEPKPPFLLAFTASVDWLRDPSFVYCALPASPDHSVAEAYGAWGELPLPTSLHGGATFTSSMPIAVAALSGRSPRPARFRITLARFTGRGPRRGYLGVPCRLPPRFTADVHAFARATCELGDREASATTNVRGWRASDPRAAMRRHPSERSARSPGRPRPAAGARSPSAAVGPR